MSGSFFLLDTNIVIAIFSEEASIIKRIQDAEGIFIPVIVIGELFYGAELSTRKEQNIKKLKEFSASSQILLCDHETAIQYAKVKSFLKSKGKPIPENDIWIAALATQHQLELSTRDKHFQSIKGLKVARW